MEIPCGENPDGSARIAKFVYTGPTKTYLASVTTFYQSLKALKLAMVGMDPELQKNILNDAEAASVDFVL
jgi:hypothetical protein